MGTWQKIITNANDSTYKNSNVDIDDLGGTSVTGSLTNFLNERGTFTVPAGTADTNQLTTFTVSATTDTNATTISQGDDLMFTAGTGVTCETTADGTVTITNTAPITSAQASAITANTSKTGITSAQASAITANTAKTGISSAQASAITANTAKNTNVSTSLSLGTKTSTTVNVNSSDGNNATLLEATTTYAGLLGADKWDEIVANTAKTGISSAQASAITANTAKTGITSAQALAIGLNSNKTGITSAQASAITANTAKTGISSAQASAITANTAKVTDQGQVSCTTTNVKSALNGNTGGLTIGDADDTIVISGNLTVNGTTTTKDSNDVNIGDAILTLNYAEQGTPSEDAGFDIERGTSTNSYIRWDESERSWIYGNGTSSANLTSSYVASAVSPPGSSGNFRVGDLWMAGTVPWIRTA